MTFPAPRSAARIKLCVYVTDMICGSRVQPSLLGEKRHERAAEIEPTFAHDLKMYLATVCQIRQRLDFNARTGDSCYNTKMTAD